ncbi:MAG: epoxyqueuosine reductase QueH [Proteobacteria bacterium]|nr:epoxyqueuosine reductase QueH [Pseudomonadota bacterium]MBU1741576.1 epoxyqueuosine reductase QueH [Pseudomonadota bacterium]
MNVLIHICCAPCAIYPLSVLRGEGAAVRGLWFNPNVQPYTEWRQRLDTLQKWAADEDLALIEMTDYDVVDWLRRMAWREAERCRICHHLRLERAARVARRGKFDAFTTTLLYSKRQDHDLVLEIGRAVAADQGVPFLERDFRPGWRAGIEASRRLGLYRQAYCGCIYSEQERFTGRQKDDAAPPSPGAEMGHQGP